MNVLAERLHKLRTERKLTQMDVAEAVGVSKSAYGYYEKGRNMPGTDVLLKLAEFFSVSSAYLLGETDDDRRFITRELREAEIEADGTIRKTYNYERIQQRFLVIDKNDFTGEQLRLLKMTINSFYMSNKMSDKDREEWRREHHVEEEEKRAYFSQYNHDVDRDDDDEE